MKFAHLKSTMEMCVLKSRTAEGVRKEILVFAGAYDKGYRSMIAFLCSRCGKSLKVKDELAGRKGRCPHCQQPTVVPRAPQTAGERSEQAGNDNDSESDANVAPPSLDADRDSQTLPPAKPRDASGLKKGNVCIPDSPASKVDPELYDFLSPPQAADEIGRLGTYRILKVLGAGGMGVVFQAEDPHLNRLVALKAMLPTLAASGVSKQRFLREARAAAAIEHDHIVAIYQVAEDRGVPLIAMPFLRGQSLDDRLKRERKLPLPEALRIARETAEGLAAAHARDMIHRDIKPANNWLEGEKGRVKILDFGLARSANDESNLTQQGTIIGTPAYMAPEQGAGKRVDTRCDLFSLGCVLYRMVTGKLPFKGADTVSTLVAVATETPKPPRDLNPAISPKLSKLILDLLAKDPKDRPASAQSVVEMLDELAKKPLQDYTEVLDEPATLVQEVRSAADFDFGTVRGDRDDVGSEKPQSRRLPMLPLLIGVGVGMFALLLIGIIAAVFIFKKNDTPTLAQNSTTQHTKDITDPQLVNPNPKPVVDPQKGNSKPPDDVSRDLKRAFGTFDEANVRSFDTEAGKQLKDIKPQPFGASDAVALGLGNVGVAGGWTAITRVLDLNSGAIKKELNAGHDTPGRIVLAVAISPDGETTIQ
jgi:serine/threonine protein kinase/DNA-directed RNA polymerase subunit RPC12/RpoP